MKQYKLFAATATLVGTVIGAGVLGIPYVIAKSGFLTAMIDLFLIAFLILMVNLFIGEVVLRTKGNHQLTGYAEKYLGKWGKGIMLFSMIVGVYGALIAYTIGSGQALSAIFTNISPFIFSLIFFAICSALVYIGMREIKKAEAIVMIVVIGIVLMIAILSFINPNFSLNNLSEFNLTKIAIPYGVILFAFIGAAAIPEMKEQLTQNRKLMKKAIIFGSLIPLVLYFIFAFAVVGISGTATTEIATIGLGTFLGQKAFILGNLFALAAMFTSFLTLGLALKGVYNYDYKMKLHYSWALTCLVPLIVFLLGLTGFVKILGISGALAGGVEGIVFALMFWKAKKMGDRKPEFSLGNQKFVGYLIMVVFTLGIIYQLFHLW